MRIVLNSRARRDDYSAAEARVISTALAETAADEIRRWPQYAVTPLRHLTRIASTLGIQALLYKDESNRLGQGSFKTLGGAYAATLKLRTLEKPDSATLCCATDGNHGRSVAFAAARQGCACVVFMHENASHSKERAIRVLGARVIRVPGTYDDSVRHARAMSREHGWILVADTSDDALDPTTCHVIQGYGVMVLEVIDQLRAEEPPTHVFVQAGVGGLAAAVAGVFAQVFGALRPRVIVVEPEAAACLLHSARAGVASRIDGDLRTVMQMLSAGEASPVAWPILQARADAFIAIADAAAIAAVRDLSQSDHETISVGVSGAAGVAGLMEAIRHHEVASSIGLQASSRVLVFGTEQAE